MENDPINRGDLMDVGLPGWHSRDRVRTCHFAKLEVGGGPRHVAARVFNVLISCVELVVAHRRGYRVHRQDKRVT